MNKEWFTPVANWMEGWFDWLATEFGDVFDGVTAAIRAVLDGLEVVLVQTPWPVVMLVIVVMAWRLAGPRVAVLHSSRARLSGHLRSMGSLDGDGCAARRWRLPLRSIRHPAWHLVRQELTCLRRRHCRCSTSCRPCRPSST